MSEPVTPPSALRLSHEALGGLHAGMADRVPGRAPPDPARPDRRVRPQRMV